MHSNLTDIILDETGQRVKKGQAKSLNGNALTVNANQYVLPMGAIPNARMLLASNKQHKWGTGNHHDLVGRYFSVYKKIMLIPLILTHHSAPIDPPWEGSERNDF